MKRKLIVLTIFAPLLIAFFVVIADRLLRSTAPSALSGTRTQASIDGTQGAGLGSPTHNPNAPPTSSAEPRTAEPEARTSSADASPPSRDPTSAGVPAAPSRGGPVAASHSKVLLDPSATPDAWRAVIARYQKNPVALQAIVEARPGRTPEERAKLLAESVTLLASLGKEGRPAFDDLLESPFRDVRMAAMNAFAVNYEDERDAMLARALLDPDPVIRAKAEALRNAQR